MIKKIKHLPNHVAIVPDGNRRWARAKNFKPWKGHYESAERLEEIAREAFNLGVKNLTFWGSSVNNLTKRPLLEKRALLDVYEKYFRKLIADKDIYEKEIQINILGKWNEQFPPNLKKILKEGIVKTKNHSKKFLNFLLAYNGDDDMLHAINKINKNESFRNKKITSKTLRSNLLTSNLPDVDLIIRTGVQGDPHNSVGFLMWQTQNSQYYFTKKMCPDFSKNDFKKALIDFSKRNRRLGK